MSKKEPKGAMNVRAQESVENLFHPKAFGNAKKHFEGVKKPRKKALSTLILKLGDVFATFVSFPKTNL
jgi:hypothetical protein